MRKSRPTYRRSLIASAGLLALVLSGCGGDGESDTAKPSAESSAKSTARPSATPDSKASASHSATPPAPDTEAPPATEDADRSDDGSDWSDDGSDWSDDGTGWSDDDEDLSITRAPKRKDAKEVLVSVDSAKGSRTIKVKPVTVNGLSWQLNCQGEGDISISMGSALEEQEGPCGGGDVNFMAGSEHGPESRTIRSVVIKAPAHVRWSLTIGRY
ncbi:hypothetical protein [Streptomyces sp. NPDC048636]|uniref:hypothetical protein n=1 Tax=Streptomyces sp. NPDC048636 TaxID=3155762 RepID=UPI0034269F38